MINKFSLSLYIIASILVSSCLGKYLYLEFNQIQIVQQIQADDFVIEDIVGTEVVNADLVIELPESINEKNLEQVDQLNEKNSPESGVEELNEELVNNKIETGPINNPIAAVEIKNPENIKENDEIKTKNSGFKKYRSKFVYLVPSEKIDKPIVYKNHIKAHAVESIDVNYHSPLAIYEKVKIEIETEMVAINRREDDIKVVAELQQTSLPVDAANSITENRYLASGEVTNTDIDQMKVEIESDNEDLVFLDLKSDENTKSELPNTPTMNSVPVIASADFKKNIDYIEEEKGGLPGSVQDAISRYMSGFDKKIDYERKNVEKESRESVEVYTSRASRNEQVSEIELKVLNVAIGKGIVSDSNEYITRLGFDSGDFLKHDQNGILQIRNNLKNENGFLNITVDEKNSLTTITDLTLEKSSLQVSVPAIDENSFREFLDAEKLSGQGAFALFDMNKSGEVNEISFEIGHTYEAKIYLDENFQKTEKDLGYRYILFIGLPPGTALVNYHANTKDANEPIHRFVFLEENAIFYDSVAYFDNTSVELELFEENLFTKEAVELDIPSEKIKKLISKKSPDKINNHTHLYNIEKQPHGSRLYLEYTHLNDSVFVGHWSNQEILLPNNNYVSAIFEKFQINDLSQNCLIQINLSDKIKDFSFEGKMVNNSIPTEVLFLGKDGSFEKQSSHVTKKIFLKGEGQGVYNIKIDYLDGKTDVFQTYCSPETYIIEQL